MIYLTQNDKIPDSSLRRIRRLEQRQRSDHADMTVGNSNNSVRQNFLASVLPERPGNAFHLMGKAGECSTESEGSWVSEGREGPDGDRWKQYMVKGMDNLREETLENDSITPGGRTQKSDASTNRADQLRSDANGAKARENHTLRWGLKMERSRRLPRASYPRRKYELASMGNANGFEPISSSSTRPLADILTQRSREPLEAKYLLEHFSAR